MSGEQSISQVKAIVLLYDDNSKKWMPSGGVQGFSMVHLYENVNGSYRIVGHHSQTRQVVINFSIPKGLNYHEATPTFHQWRFKQLVYGLNFVSEEDAAVFSVAVKGALCTLDTGSNPTPSYTAPVQAASSQNPPNTQRACDTESAEQRTGQSAIPQAPPLPQATPSHYATPKPQSVSQIPPAPPLPNSSGIPTPPPLSSIVGGGVPAPPQPPPLSSVIGRGAGDTSGDFAAALASAKLKKVSKSDEGSGRGGLSSSVGSSTSGGGGGNLMQEMQDRLKKRQKTVGKSLPQDNAETPDEGESNNIRQNADGAGRRRDSPANMTNRVKPAETGGGSRESRHVSGRDDSSRNCDYNRLKQVEVGRAFDWATSTIRTILNNADKIKAFVHSTTSDIMDDLRKELQSVKEEIIAAIRSELGKINT